MYTLLSVPAANGRLWEWISALSLLDLHTAWDSSPLCAGQLMPTDKSLTQHGTCLPPCQVAIILRCYHLLWEWLHHCPEVAYSVSKSSWLLNNKDLLLLLFFNNKDLNCMDPLNTQVFFLIVNTAVLHLPRWVEPMSSEELWTQKRKKEKKGNTKSCPILVFPWTIARQAPLSMGFSRQEYWSGLPFPSPGELPDPGTEPRSPALQADTLPTELHGNTEGS